MKYAPVDEFVLCRSWQYLALKCANDLNFCKALWQTMAAAILMPDNVRMNPRDLLPALDVCSVKPETKPGSFYM